MCAVSYVSFRNKQPCNTTSDRQLAGTTPIEVKKFEMLIKKCLAFFSILTCFCKFPMAWLSFLDSDDKLLNIEFCDRLASRRLRYLFFGVCIILSARTATAFFQPIILWQLLLLKLTVNPERLSTHLLGLLHISKSANLSPIYTTTIFFRNLLNCLYTKRHKSFSLVLCLRFSSMRLRDLPRKHLHVYSMYMS